MVRLILPYVHNFGSPAFRRRVLDKLPMPKSKGLAKVVDGLQSGAELIVKEKRDALAKGDEAVQQLVSNGKDIMSVLRELDFKVPIF